MMYVNQFDRCYNLSLAYRIYADGTYVRADFQLLTNEIIETFDTKQKAIDFIHWVAQEMKK